MLHHSCGDCCGDGVLFIAPTRVGIAVYPRVPGELVGSAEAFRAARESTGVGLLARVGPDMTGLVLEAVEGLLAQRALVRPGQVLSLVFLLGLVVLEHGSH
jgi:hypothetical protein